MSLDMFASVVLTALAAIAISTIAIGFGGSPRARIRIGVVFSIWFVFVAILAATKTLQYNLGTGVPLFGLVVMLPIVVLWLAMRWSEPLNRALRTVPLPLLIGVHSIRVLGVFFLILYDAGRLPAPFGPAAGWGDIITGIAAVPVAWLAYKKVAVARPAIWIWNAFGLADLVSAIGLGAVSAPGAIRLIFAEPGTAILTSLPWLLIPGYIVPLMATIHLAVFYRLAKDYPQSAGRSQLSKTGQQQAG